jgi:hypothetical protein
MNFLIKKFIILSGIFSLLYPFLTRGNELDSLEVGKIFILGEPTMKDTKRNVMRYRHLLSTNSTPEALDLNYLETGTLKEDGYIWEGEYPISIITQYQSFNTKTFYIDSIFSLKGIKYALCYWIDERVMAYNKDAVDYNHQKYLYVLKDPTEAILAGEVVLCDKKYLEPMLIEEPTRAIKLFIERNSKVTLSIITLLYGAILLLLNRILIYRNLNTEITNGNNMNIPKDDYYKYDKTKK